MEVSLILCRVHMGDFGFDLLLGLSQSKCVFLPQKILLYSLLPLLVIDLGLCGHSGKLNQVFDLKENSLVVVLVVRKKKNQWKE